MTRRLEPHPLIPSTDRLPWHARAACLGDHEPFDHPNTAAAKAICFDCPVRQACLDDALATEEPGHRYLVRGGLDPDERAALSYKKPGFAPRPINHHTYGGYMAHKRRGEDPCRSCRDAYRDYQREKRAKDAARKRAVRGKASA